LKTLYKELNKDNKITTANHNISIIDLFAGCGGLAYGFAMEDMLIASGVEIDENACKTSSYNLHWKYGRSQSHINGDMRELDATSFISDGKKPVITIGGPPCQAYSKIGRAKLQSLGEDRFGINDERAFLYKEFLRVGLELDSEAIIMENVPESVNFLGMNIPQIVCDTLKSNGYHAIWTILNSADFGVPQTRRRVFVIAVKKKYGQIEHLPEPTNSNLFLQTEEQQLSRYQRFTSSMDFRLPNTGDLLLPPWITSGQALSDLPSLFPSSEEKYSQVKMETGLTYRFSPLNEYQNLMRKSSREEYTLRVDANSFRKTMRDFRVFEKMEPNANYLDAHKIALELFNEACIVNKVNKITQPNEYKELKRKYVPPYDTTKFHSKWRRLDPKLPSHTLVAHLGTDTYSHIHPFEPRGISVREAARLQSFPDDYIFNVPMGSAFTQIGNAVPPLLSKAVAKAVKRNLQIL